jgi:hypothetical protein
MEPILHSYFIEPGSIDCPDGWRCSIEPNKEWARGQKETRILAALEPVTGQHRLVVSRAVAANERLQTQYTRLTRQRNSRHTKTNWKPSPPPSHSTKTGSM